MYKLILLLLSLLMLSCTDDLGDSLTNNSNNDSTNDLFEFDGEDFVSGTVMDSIVYLQDTLDTLTVEFPVKEGYVYNVVIRETEDDYNARMSIVNYSKSFGGWDDTFEAESTVTQQLQLILSSAKTVKPSYPVKVQIVEFRKVGSQLDGTWLLVKEETRIVDITQTNYYSLSDAKDVFALKDGKHISYYYEDGETQEYVGPISPALFNDQMYKITDSSLTLFRGCEAGYMLREYRRIDENTDFTWYFEGYTIPDEFVGTWYLESDQVKLFQKGSYSPEGIPFWEQVPSDSLQTTKYYKFEKDSVTEWSKNLYGVREYRYSASRFFDEFKHATLQGGQLVFTELDNEYPYYGYWSFMQFKQCLRKVEGNEPPASWLKNEIPDDVVRMEIGETYTSEHFSSTDTVWLEYSLEPLTGYTFEFDYNDYNYTSLAFLDSNGKRAYIDQIETAGLYYFAFVVTVYDLSGFGEDVTDVDNSFTFTLLKR